MKKLIRIVYVSRSTFAPVASARGLEPNIARILAKSRSNNRKNGLVGVLYFGDGCFFQCLEGEESAIDTLYGKLERDPRHSELKLLSREDIAQTTFSAWSMKYIPSEHAIQTLLREEGLELFDPYRFSATGIRKMLALLFEANDPEHVAKLAPVPVPEPKVFRQAREPAVAAFKSGERRHVSNRTRAFLVFSALLLGAICLKYAFN